MHQPAPASSTGAALRTLREGMRLQLTEVANEAKTSVSYLSEVENDKRRPTRAYVARVTEAITLLIKSSV